METALRPVRDATGLLTALIFCFALLSTRAKSESVTSSQVSAHYLSSGHGDTIDCPLRRLGNSSVAWQFEQLINDAGGFRYEPVAASAVSDIFKDVGDGKLVFKDANTGKYEDRNSHPKYRIYCTVSDVNLFGAKLVTVSKKIAPTVWRKFDPHLDCYDASVGGTARCCLRRLPKALLPHIEVKFYRRINDNWLQIIDTGTGGSRKYVIFSHGYHCLHVLHANSADASQQYRAEIRAGSVSQWSTSSPKSFAVEDRPRFAEILDASVSVGPNQRREVQLPCSSPSPITSDTITWTQNGKELSEFGGLKWELLSDSSGDLSVEVAGRGASGLYECRLAGRVLARVKLIVYVEMSVTMKMDEDSVEIGSNVTVKCSALGGPVDSLFWLKNGQLVTDSYRRRSLLTSGDLGLMSTLYITGVTVGDMGVYQCVASRLTNFTDGAVPHDCATAAETLLVKITPPSLRSQTPSATLVPVDLRNDAESSGSVSCLFDASPAADVTVTLDGSPSLYDRYSGDVFVNRTRRIGQSSNVTIDYRLRHLHHTGVIRIMADSSYGSAECEFELMAVQSSPSLKVRSFNEHYNVLKLKPFNLDCYVLGGVNQAKASQLPEELREAAVQYQLEWSVTKRSDGQTLSLPLDHNMQVGVSGRPNRLSFSRMQPEFTGRYTCTASNLALTSSASTELQVREGVQPVSQKDELNLDRVHSISGSCNVQNLPSGAWYAWWIFYGKDGKPQLLHTSELVTYPERHPRLPQPQDLDVTCPGNRNRFKDEVPFDLMQRSGRSARLHIVHPKNLEFEGTFVCRIISCYDEASVKKIVKFRPVYEFRPNLPPNVVEFVEGTSASVTCALNEVGPHVPRLTWYSGSSRSPEHHVPSHAEGSEHRVSQFPNGTLVIAKVLKEDKSFLCITELHSSITKSKVVHIKVKEPATVLPFSNKRLELKTGSSKRIECRVDGHGATVTWLGKFGHQQHEWCRLTHAAGAIHSHADYKDCRSFYITSTSTNTHPASITVEDNRFLVFKHVNDGVKGLFKCRAHNQYNARLPNPFSEQQLQVQVIERPGPVRSLRCTDRGHKWLRLQWEPPTDTGNKPIMKYLLTFNNSTGFQQRQESLPSTKSTTVTNLQPGFTYTFNVSAVNTVGPGHSNLLHVTTKEMPPTGGVLELTAEACGSTGILARWNPPDPLKRNGRITNYTVEYRMLSPASADCSRGEFKLAFHCKKLQSLVGIGASTYGLCGGVPALRADTHYQIRVTPVNVEGAGPPVCVTARTLESGPHSPPRDLRCKATAADTVEVTWQPPYSHSLNGRFNKYHVQLVPTWQLTLLNETGQRELDTRERRITIDGLEAFTDYTFTVTVSNEKGRSSRTQPQSCRTLPGVPEAPQHLKVTGVNSSHALVTWLRPAQPRGELIGYRLRISVDGSANHTEVPVSLTRHMLGPLLPGVRYQLRVRAVNRHTAGGFTNPVLFTGILKPPLRIVSYSKKLSVQKNSQLLLDCEIVGVGNHRPVWSCPVLDAPEYENLPNGSIRILSVKTGVKFRCSTEDSEDSVEYFIHIISGGQPTPHSPELLPGQRTNSSLEVLWRTRGTKGGLASDAEVKEFELEYVNLHTGNRYKRILPAGNRSHLVDPVECGAVVEFRVKVSTGLWSDSSIPLRMQAVGTQPQLVGNPSAVFSRLTHNTIEFNFSVVLPGNGCQADKYTVYLPRNGNEKAQTAEWPRTRLVNGCCANATFDLAPNTEYRYRIVAQNAAGSTNFTSKFRTQRTTQLTSIDTDPQAAGWTLTDLMIGLGIVVGVALVFGVLVVLITLIMRPESPMPQAQGGRKVTMRVRDGRAVPANQADDAAEDEEFDDDDNMSTDSQGRIRPYCTTYNPPTAAALPPRPSDYTQGRPAHLTAHLTAHQNAHLPAPSYYGRNASSVSSTDHELYRAYQRRQEYEENSGSSGTTDPGILKFTSRPPDANEIRKGACEMPVGTGRTLMRQMSTATSRTYDTIDPPRQRRYRNRTTSDADTVEDASYYSYNYNTVCRLPQQQQQLLQQLQFQQYPQYQTYQQYGTRLPDRSRARAMERARMGRAAADDEESRQRLLSRGRVPPLPQPELPHSQSADSNEDPYDNNIVEV